MTGQRRNQLLVGGTFLAAVVLVGLLLLTNQTQWRAPAASEPTAPIANTAPAAVTAASAAEPSPQSQSVSAAITPTVTSVDEVTSTAAQPDSPLAIAASATITADRAAPATEPTLASAAAASPLATPTQPVVPTATVAPPTTPTAVPSPTLPPPVFAGAEDIPVYTYEIVATYPHDPEAFTQGLQWIDDVLYEGTGLYGRSSLRRADLATGEVLQQTDLADDLFGEGIVVVDDRIYQITWQARRGFIYDRSSFERIGEFAYQTEGWGLTFDGENLVMSDGTNRLFWRDPETLAVVRQVDVLQQDVPVPLLNELEYVQGEIFANVWQSDWIARIDPETGRVVGWIDLTGLLDGVEATGPIDVLNGIAYDAATDRLFITGKLWPVLFEIDLIER